MSKTVPPSYPRRAWDLAKNLAAFIADGCTTVGVEEYRRRLGICDTCEHRDGDKCLKCGCPLISMKAKGRVFACPIGKWRLLDSESPAALEMLRRSTIRKKDRPCAARDRVVTGYRGELVNVEGKLPAVRIYRSDSSDPRQVAPVTENVLLPVWGGKISIVMPTYNQAEFIREAIDSILSQTHENWELVVVNDGSTDDTESVVGSYHDPRIRYMAKQNGGTGSALNHGFGLTDGEYETWLSSDNAFYPDALRRMAGTLCDHPDVGFVYSACDVGITVETARSIGEIVNQKYDADRLTHHNYIGMSFLWRRWVRESAGGFSTEMNEDYDFALRVQETNTKIHFLPESLGWFREHDKTTSATVRSCGLQESVRTRIIHGARTRRFPRKAWFYWGGALLPYLRYLSLATFCRHNPGWDVTLFRPKRISTVRSWSTEHLRYAVEGSDYSGRLDGLPINMETFDPAEIGFKDDLAENHKADVLRLHLLSSEGGLWSDMDIVYFAPVNVPLHHDTYVCDRPPYGHSTGFMLSTADNPVFQFLLGEARMVALSAMRDYQGFGPFLFEDRKLLLADIDRKNTKRWPSLDKTFYNLPMDLVYAYDADHVVEIHRTVAGKPLRFTDRSIGCHWYAGNPLAAASVNGINENNLDRQQGVLGIAIRRALA